MRRWLSKFFSRNRVHPINDIIFKPRQRVVRLRERSLILEISWLNLFSLLRRHWVRAGIGTAIVVSAIIFVSSNVGRANIATLYATSCLGGWDNPQLAEGAPDVKVEKPDSELFTSKNSAQLKASAAQIFCGAFKGEVPTGVQPKKVLLKLSWTVLGANPIIPASGSAVPTPLPEPEKPVIIEDVAKPEQVQAIIDSPENQAVELHANEPVVIPTAVEQSVPEPLTPPSPPAPVIIESPALSPPPAPEPPPPPAPAPTSETSWLPWKVSTVKAQELIENVSVSSTTLAEVTSTDIIVSTGTAVSADPPFLQVMYTLDGSTWNKLAMVSAVNWRDFSVELPLTSWAELATVQTSLQTVPSLAEQPAVLLDSIWLEVEYQGDADTVQDQPDLQHDTIIQLLYAEPYYALKIFSQARQRHEVWVYQVSGSGEWQEPVVEPDFDVNQPIALHGNILFWLGPGQQTINAYDVSSRTYSSQTLDPTQPNILMAFGQEGWIVSWVNNQAERGAIGHFVFSVGNGQYQDAEGINASRDDLLVRLGFAPMEVQSSTSSVTSTVISSGGAKEPALLPVPLIEVLPTEVKLPVFDEPVQDVAPAQPILEFKPSAIPVE